MLTDTSITVFFGDAERTFKLTPALVGELERKTGAGIGALCKRMFSGDFAHADCLEAIRLGLVGGGTSPEDAHNLVRVYAAEAPIEVVMTLAVQILSALWFGVSPASALTDVLTPASE
jgi:hypothetical protein